MAMFFPKADKQFYGLQTTVFWDLDDSSILDGLDPFSVFDNITSALETNGYNGQVLIEAYVDENTLLEEFTYRYRRAGIHIDFVPQGDKCSRVYRMLHRLLFWALNNVNIPSTLILLSKNIQESTLFSALLEKAFSEKQRNYNVVVASLESLLGEVPIGQKRIQERNGIFIVICGISGFDIGPVINQLQEVNKELHFPVTITTNCDSIPRQHYLLVQEDEFETMVMNNELLIYGRDKGVSKKEIHEFMSRGADIVLGVVNIYDLLKLQGVLGNSAMYILLVPESKLSMEASSEAVKTEKELVRLARKEYKHLDFDYLVVDGEGKLDCTVNRLKSIIKGEKCKVCPRTLKI